MQTPDGAQPISEIAVGESVLAYNEATRTTGTYTVTDTFSHLDPVVVELTLGGETIETTPEHPFYVLLRGWVDAGDLRPGMAVRQADGSYGRVEHVTVEQRAEEMYNLTVADAHTFFVGDEAWLVHNACNVRSQLGAGGRLEVVDATIGPADLGTGTATNSSSRNLARGFGQTTDDAGHAVGKGLGGRGGSTSQNIFPQNPHFNRGVYRDYEQEVAQYIRTSGRNIDVKITFSYSTPTGTRPVGVTYESFHNGLPIPDLPARSFFNP